MQQLPSASCWIISALACSHLVDLDICIRGFFSPDTFSVADETESVLMLRTLHIHKVFHKFLVLTAFDYLCIAFVYLYV